MDGKTFVNIDELCIKYGDSIGIPPQFIKGQIQSECFFSQHLNMPVPSYRFEPYKIAVAVNNLRAQYKSNPYFIRSLTDNAMGSGPNIPSTLEHQNVCPIPYIQYPKSLWDVIYDYSELAIPKPPRADISESQHKLFGQRTPDGKMDFSVCKSTKMQEWYNVEYYHFDGKNGAADSARKSMATSAEEFFSTVVAQTRMASSYGYLQCLYTTAIIGNKIKGLGYPKSLRPEDLNNASICELYQFARLKYIVNYQTDDILNNSSGCWDNGYENFFMNYIFPKWNPGDSTYPNTVLSHSYDDPPQK